MADIFETEYDPVFRVRRDFRYTDDGKVHVFQKQDIEPALQRAYDNRKENKRTNTDDIGLNLYAELEYIHLHEALRDGVDLDNGDEMVKWVNKKHPELRHTKKWHGSHKAKSGTSKVIVR